MLKSIIIENSLVDVIQPKTCKKTYLKITFIFLFRNNMI